MYSIYAKKTQTKNKDCPSIYEIILKGKRNIEKTSFLLHSY